MMHRLISWTLLLSLSLLACDDSSIPEDFDYGKVNGRSYTNAFFDFELETRKDWHILNADQLKQLIGENADAAVGRLENGEKLVEAAEIKTAYLFNTYQYPLEWKGNYNPSIMVLAENLAESEGIESGRDYLIHTKELMEASGVVVEFDLSRQATLDGEVFDIMGAKFQQPNYMIQQDYYARIKNGFCLVIIASYIDRHQQRDLEQIIASYESD